MIPEKFDDGFTTDLGDGRLCRQMTWARLCLWKETARSDVQEALRQATSPPFLLRGKVTSQKSACEVVEFVTAYTFNDEEDDLRNLADSATLHTHKPLLSLLSCEECHQFCVDHSTGEIQRYPDGTPKKLSGGMVVPCEVRAADSPGCAKGHWKSSVGLSYPRWALTWRHFWRYRNDPPTFLRRDPIFIRNTALLNWIVDYGRRPEFNPFIGGDVR
jgi:hypothetical protein